MSRRTSTSIARKPTWWTSPPPSVGVEIAPRRVTAASLTFGSGRATVSAHATEALPEGIVAPGLAAPNITDAGACAQALRRAFEQIGVRPRRVALVIPDTAAKVSLVRFEKVPPRAEDLDALIRWQMRKSAPFRLEEGQIAYVPGLALPEGGQEFIVTIARRDIVEEYERVCAAVGAQAGLVDLASFNLINLVLAGDAVGTGVPGSPALHGGDRAWGSEGSPRAQVSGLQGATRAWGSEGPPRAQVSGVQGATRAWGSEGPPRAQVSGVQGAPRVIEEDWLLVHVTPEYSTLAIMRGANLIFFRNRAADAEGSLADLVHQTSMYYEDRLGGAGFGRVLLAGAGTRTGGAAELRRSLEERVGGRIEAIDPRVAAALTDRIVASPDLLDTLAPVVGLVLREVAA